MNKREADKEAKRLYGPKAFARISPAEHRLKDVLIDNVPIPGITGTLLGWGKTWEEAFALAKIRSKWHTKRGTLRHAKKKQKPRQVQNWKK